MRQQIEDLEQEVQAQLLRRTRRSVELTPSGRFLEPARILADADELKEVACGAQRGYIGQLSIGFVHSAGYSIMPLS